MISPASQAVGAKLSLVEKLGYGLGDTASNLVFQTIVNFIAFYYTDVVGLTPAVVSVIFLVVRVADAVLDPVMGAVADRTHTRWGQFRPWILWLAIPFSASAVLAFSVPQAAGTGPAIYAFVSYMVLMIFYTGVNIPYGAMAAAMTADPQERTSLQSWRFAMAMGGNMVVSAGTLPLVAAFGKGDPARGYLWTMAVFGALALVMLIACFAITRERVQAPACTTPSSLARDLKALWANDQWRILALVNFVLLISVVMRGTAALYFIRYALGEPDRSTAFLTLGAVGGVVGSLFAGRLHDRIQGRELLLLAGVHSGLMAMLLLIGLVDGRLAMIGTLAIVAGYGLAKLSGRWLDRVPAFGVLFLLQALAQVALYLSPAWGFDASTGIFVLALVLNQVAVPILWALMADSVDYGQWKTDVRITGLNFSATLFALKMGVAVGGALATAMLGWFGYVANQAQTPEAIQGIAVVFGLAPAGACLIVAALSLGIRLTLTEMARVQSSTGLAEARE